MTTQKVKRKLTAILSSDVEGYSRLTGKDEVSTQAGKAAEIAVCGTKNQSMLDRKGCQMGIRNQICPQALIDQQRFQGFSMAVGGLRNPDRRTIQPLFDLLPRFIDGLM
jgi:hypothetical protein